MDYGLENMEIQKNEELQNVEIPNERTQEITDSPVTASLSTLTGYGLYRISTLPEVKEYISEKIDELKEGFKEAYESTKDTISKYTEKVTGAIKDYCCGVYENVKDFFTSSEKPNITDTQFPEASKLCEGITEGREFGLDECTEAALEIFNPGVISEWGNLSDEERKGIALEYAERVASAFELVNYNGVYIEQLDPGVLGYNNGDGSIHLSPNILSASSTPFEIMNTITHELRHQYQSECIRGYHDVSDEVRNEWAIATAIYNYDQPSCYDPWGYQYNPLEVDARYAGETVVRNVSSQMFNDAINS